jgi:hypothetical protein
MSRLRLSQTLPILALLISSAAARSEAVSRPGAVALIPPGEGLVVGMEATERGYNPPSFLPVTRNNYIDFEDFLAFSGADGSRFISQVIMIADAHSEGRDDVHSLTASGRFDQARIYASAIGVGAKRGTYRAVPMLIVPPTRRRRRSVPDESRWLVILDSTTLLLGTPDLVKTQIDRKLDGAAEDPELQNSLSGFKRGTNIWCIVSKPFGKSKLQTSLMPLSPQLADLAGSGCAFRLGIRYAHHIEIEYQGESVCSKDEAKGPPDNLPPDRPNVGAGHFALSTSDKTAQLEGGMHNRIRISRRLYERWLEIAGSID